MGNVYIGTSGFNYKHWKGIFYPVGLPEREWLDFYVKVFETVELNVTFYTEVSKAAYKHWYEHTPDGFKFAVKAYRYMTQLKKLHEVDDSAQRFIEQARQLKEKLAVILWQFPRNFAINADNADEYKGRLEHLLSILPQDIPHAFEFRDKSWFTPEIKAILDRYHASFVISDSARFPKDEIIGSDFTYIRFHGPRALYSSNYSHDRLRQWAEKIQELRKDHDIFCYFNNDVGGYAIDNAKELQALTENKLARR